MSTTSRIPSYTEIYTTSPTAAGLPVLEVIRRLEEEKLVTKNDRVALKDGLYSSDVTRREEIVKALCEVELSMNSRFSIRRLKAIIHQNGSGEVSSKNQQKMNQLINNNDLELGQTGTMKLSSNNNTTTNTNHVQPLKLDSQRPSKYRMLQKNYLNTESSAGTVVPVERSSTSYSASHTSGHTNNTTSNITNNSIIPSTYIPSSSNSHTTSTTTTAGPLKLFPSPTQQQQPTVLSAREKGLNPNNNNTIVPHPPTESPNNNNNNASKIRYMNNNIPMRTPNTSRSRDDGSRTANSSSTIATTTGSTNIHTQPQASSMLHTPNTSRSPGPGMYTSHTSTSSTGSTGRPPRISPYRNNSTSDSTNPTTNNAYNSSHITESVVNNAEEEEGLENISTIRAIHQVVGPQLVYSGPDSSYNVLSKIAHRLHEFHRKYDVATRGRRKLAVLVGGGSFNPLTRMHLRTYFLAKQCLEAKYGYVVLGSLLSPAHGATVRERYRTNPSEILPSPHRLAVAQLLVQNSKLLSIDPWEITRRRAMDYLSLLEHVNTIIREEFEFEDIKLLYICKPNLIPKLSPQALRENNYSVVTVCRTQESDLLRKELTSKWNGIITVVEDTAILDASMDVITSRKVRDRIKQGHSVEQLVGEKINDYVQVHRLGLKMTGVEKWEKEEKILPNLVSRPGGPTLPSHIHKHAIEQQLAYNQSVLDASNSQAGEYSPDRVLLPINELSTLNMSKHNKNTTTSSSYSSNIVGNIKLPGNVLETVNNTIGKRGNYTAYSTGSNSSSNSGSMHSSSVYKHTTTNDNNSNNSSIHNHNTTTTTAVVDSNTTNTTKDGVVYTPSWVLEEED